MHASQGADAAAPTDAHPAGPGGRRLVQAIRRAGLTPALSIFLLALMAGPVVMYLALVNHAERTT